MFGNNVYQIWVLINRTSFLKMLAGLVPIDATNEGLVAIRRRLGRWVMLAYELAILKARGQWA